MGLDIFTQRIALLIVENLNCLCHYHWVRTGYTVAYVAGPRTGREETGKGTSLTPAHTKGYCKTRNKNVQLVSQHTANELGSDVARFTVHELSCIALICCRLRKFVSESRK